ncbi:MAG: isopeptide-forming domain-containing fimbrial protein [Oscillospiraceae bacterium]
MNKKKATSIIVALGLAVMLLVASAIGIGATDGMGQNNPASEVLAAPAGATTPALSEKDLRNLIPNLEVFSESVDTGTQYVGGLSGTVSLDTGKIAEGISFKLVATGSLELYPDTSANSNVSYSRPDDNDLQTLIITVGQLPNSGETQVYATFRFAFPNGVTPNGTVSNIALTEVSDSKGTSIKKNAQWGDASDVVDKQLSVDVTAKSKTGWALANPTPTTTTLTVASSQVVADVSGGYYYDLNRAVTVAANNAASSAAGYEFTTSVTYQVQIKVSDPTPNDVNILYTSADFAKMALTGDAYEEYFTLDATSKASLTKIATNLSDQTITLTFSKTVPAGSDVGNLSSTITFKKVRFSSALTIAQSFNNAKITVSYVTDSAKVTPVSGQLTLNNANTANIVLNKKDETPTTPTLPTLESVIKDSAKGVRNWVYNVQATGADKIGLNPDGETDAVARNYITSRAIPGDSHPNRIWFEVANSTYFKNTTGAKIDSLTITDADKNTDVNGNKGYDSTQMYPIGFQLANIVNDNQQVKQSVEIYKDGSWQVVFNNGALTSLGTSLFEKPVSSVDAYVLKTTTAGYPVRFNFSNIPENAQIGTIQRPAILFQANSSIDLGTALVASFQNTATISAQAGAKTAQKDVSGTVYYYAKNAEDILIGKAYKNLTRPNDGTSSSYNQPVAGDVLEYTIKIEATNIPSGDYLTKVWVRDTFYQNLVNSNMQDIRATVKVTTAKGSTIELKNTSDGKVSAGGQYSYSNTVPFVKGSDYKLSDGQMAFIFEGGRFYQGDVITITYQATVAGGVVAGDEVINKLAYIFGTSSGGGGSGGGGTGGGGGGWNWPSDTGGATVIVDANKLFADVDITPDKTVYAADTGTKVSFSVVGGTPYAEVSAKRPVFVVNVPAALVLQDNAVAGVALSSIGTDRTLTKIRDIAASEYTVTYHAANGTVADASSSVYARIDFTNLTLDKNQVISFTVNAEIANTAADSVNIKASADLFFAGADNDFAGLFGGSAINKWYTTAGTIASGTLRTVALNGATAGAISRVEKVSSAFSVYQYSSKLGFTKSITSPAAEGTTRPVFKGDTITYKLLVSNASGANITNPLKFTVLTDLLPIGQTYSNITSITANGVSIPASNYTVHTDNVENSQRVIIVFKQEVSVNSQKDLTIVYNAKVTNDDLIYSLIVPGDFLVKLTNRASVYYNASVTDAQITAGIAQGGYDATQPDWWDIKDATGMDDASFNSFKALKRLESSATMDYRPAKIKPAITKTLVSGDETVTAVTGTMHEWKLVATNASSASSSLTNYWVVDVLPLGLEYSEVKGTTPEPTQIYKNTAGNQIIAWNFTDPLAANTSVTLTFSTKLSGTTSIGKVTNNSYLIPTQYFSSYDTTSTYISATDLGNTFVPASGGSSVPVNKPATYASKTITLLNFVGATSSKTVTVDGKISNPESVTSLSAGRGQSVTYQFSLNNQNTTGKSYTNIYFLDSLPTVGDQYVLTDGNRDSAWAPTLTKEQIDSVKASLAAPTGSTTPLEFGTDFTLEFTASAFNKLESWQKATWVSSETWDWDKAAPAAFRIIFADTVSIAPKYTLSVSWQMNVPDAVADAPMNQATYNSAMFYMKSGDAPYYGEPAKVGLRVAGDSALSLSLMKKLSNTSSGGTFAMTLYYSADKVNWAPASWNGVSSDNTALQLSGDDGILTISASNASQAYGGVLTGLKEGYYRLVEDSGHSALYNISYANNDLYLSKASGTPAITVTNTLKTTPGSSTSTGGGGGGGSSGGGTSSGSRSTTPARSSSVSATGSAGSVSGGASSGSGSSSSQSVVSLPNPPIPDTTLDGPTWALLNLICTVLSLVISVALTVSLFVRSKPAEDETDEDGEEVQGKKGRSGIVWRLLGIAMGIIGLIIFLLTQDMSASMGYVDIWTVLSVLATIIQIIFLFILRHFTKQDDIDDENDPTSPAQQY